MTLNYSLALMLILPLAAHAACDIRKLPAPDTRSVEAAARTASGGRALHVEQACITGTTTAVTLVSDDSWEINCIRQQSTWYKRGGWTCDEPKKRITKPRP